MEITWNNCFSAKRFGANSKTKDDRTQYERDWDRIIFSSAFRQLQNKTQVFPLPEEAFVHNRLTHSLEVASIGRSLGQIIGDKLSGLKEITEDEIAQDFYRNNLKNVIASACLAHDLGNPAFGHSGEEAISKYFKQKEKDVDFRKLFSDNEWKDVTTFEGNANALRLLTKNNNGGFRLTYSTLGAIIKYPCESVLSNKSILHRKKYGYFKIDEDVFLSVAKELNMVEDSSNMGISYKRHPFVFLVEAADDIAYNIIDFEDAHRLGILSYNDVKEAFFDIIKTGENFNEKGVKDQLKELGDNKTDAISYLRAKAIGTLLNKTVNVFWENKEAILKGEFSISLLNAIPELKDAMKAINTKSVEQIYNAESVIKLEIAGFRIMSGLVEDFVSSALVDKNSRTTEQKKIMHLLPSQFTFKESDSAYVKVMHIIDFISEMTDVNALKLYRKLRGIEI